MGEKMVDKVVRLAKDPKHIRNIAICAHIDHGKTTLSDNLLAGAGMMSEELAGKACQLDFHEDEQERGITIDSAAVSMVHTLEDEGKDAEFLINLIDTPGHVDFGGDVTRAMRAVDGAVVLVDAVEGMMPQTETVLKQALREYVKPILFINKVDRLIKELQLTPEAMQEKFISVIKNVNKFIEGAAPPELKNKWQVNVQDGSVCFGSGFHNWALSIPFMQKNGITFKDITEAYEGGDHTILRKKCPLHTVMLNSVVRHHPAPTQAQEYRIPKLWSQGDLESPDGKSLLNCNPDGPLYFVVIKVVIDPNAGEIAAGRLFSGTIKRGQEVSMLKAKSKARVQQVSIYNGAKRELVESSPCGNIIGVVGLKDAYPGETVTLSPDAEPFEQIQHIFDPVVTKAIEATKPADLPKLIEVLRQVGKEDPTLQVTINEETGENLIAGMGELHLEVVENRIMKEKNVVVKSSPPIVVFRETVTKESQENGEGKSPNKHNRLYFKVEPLSPQLVDGMNKKDIPEMRVKKKDNFLWEKLQQYGMASDESRKVRDIFNGNILVDGTRGIVHIGEIQEMVNDMFEDVMARGPVANEPCINVKVTLVDCKLHEDAIHRGPAQLYPAVREGIRDAMRLARPMLYEPIQELQFESPADYMGEISKLISNKRGQLLDMQQQGDHVTVKGKLPVAEMFGLTSELRSATGGRGNFFLINQTFEKLPEELQDKIIHQIRNRKGLKTGEEE